MKYSPRLIVCIILSVILYNSLNENYEEIKIEKLIQINEKEKGK